MKRILIFALIISIIGVVFIAKGNCEKREEWKQSREIITVTVRHGEGIDTYGVQYCPSWMDIREYRYEVMELNNMDTAMINAGQELKLYAGGN